MNPVAKNKRGRPKGSGAQLTGSQRALNSRSAKQLAGFKRTEVWLSKRQIVLLNIMKREMRHESSSPIDTVLLWSWKMNRRHKATLKQISQELVEILNETYKLSIDMVGEFSEKHRDLPLEVRLAKLNEFKKTPNFKKLDQLYDKIYDFSERVDYIREDQESALDLLSDAAQESERGERIEKIIDNLEQAKKGLEDALIALEEALR